MPISFWQFYGRERGDSAIDAWKIEVWEIFHAESGVNVTVPGSRVKGLKCEGVVEALCIRSA
jgi:hypothetical protein